MPHPTSKEVQGPAAPTDARQLQEQTEQEEPLMIPVADSRDVEGLSGSGGMARPI